MNDYIDQNPFRKTTKKCTEMPRKLRKASGQAKVTIKCLFMFKYYALLKVNAQNFIKKKFQGWT